MENLCFHEVLITGVDIWENENSCGNTSCRQVFPQLFQVLPTYMSVTITLWKLEKIVFYFFYNINAQKIFYMHVCIEENGFQPTEACTLGVSNCHKNFQVLAKFR